MDEMPVSKPDVRKAIEAIRKLTDDVRRINERRKTNKHLSVPLQKTPANGTPVTRREGSTKAA